MRKIFAFIAMALVAGGAMAQDFITLDDIFRVVESKYITLANEDEDVKEAMAAYDAIIAPYGYVHELVGDGYGGPCAIIDGYYKGGVNDVANAVFVPQDEMASLIFISACNGDGADYGYPEVTLTVFTETAAAVVLNQILDAGFELFHSANPEDDDDLTILYNGDRQVYISETDESYEFEFGITQ